MDARAMALDGGGCEIGCGVSVVAEIVAPSLGYVGIEGRGGVRS